MTRGLAQTHWFCKGVQAIRLISTSWFPQQVTSTSSLDSLKVLTTDRFFNGLLQQHHFGPREIDFSGSEASDDLFVSLVDHGVISTWPAHKVSKAGDEVQHVQRVRLCWFGGLGRHELKGCSLTGLPPLGWRNFWWTRSSAWLKGLQPTFFRSGKILCERFRCKLKVILRLDPFSVRKDTLQIPRHLFVICCLLRENGSLFKRNRCHQ